MLLMCLMTFSSVEPYGHMSRVQYGKHNQKQFFPYDFPSLISVSFAWSIYNGENFPHHPILPKLTSLTGENSYMRAEILDCGNIPLTFLDNIVAFKQFEKAHKVIDSAELNFRRLSGRKSAAKRYPLLITAHTNMLYLHVQRSSPVR